jgi:formylglycine-generating enzyme required for sulfatase activity
LLDKSINVDCLRIGLTDHIASGNEYDIKDKTYRPLFLAPPWTEGTHESYWTLNAIDSIAVFDKTLFVGKARSGKSTTLKILTLALTEKYFNRNTKNMSKRLVSNFLDADETYIPVYIDMRDMRQWLKNYPTIKNKMQTYFEFLISKGKHNEKQCLDCWGRVRDENEEDIPFLEVLIGKKILFIFDNYFDGIESSGPLWNGKDACEGGIYNFTEVFTDAKFVISKRADEGVDKGTEWFSDFTKIYMKVFDENSVFDFIVNKRMKYTSSNEKLAGQSAQILRRELNKLGFSMGSFDSPRFLTKLMEYANDRYEKTGNFFVPNKDRTEFTKTIIIRHCLYAIIADIAKDSDNNHSVMGKIEPIISDDILWDVCVFDNQKRSQQSRNSFQWFKALLCKIANRMMTNSLSRTDGKTTISSKEIEALIEDMNINRSQQQKKEKIISLLSGKNGLLVRVLGNQTFNTNDDVYEFENKLFFRYLVAKNILTNERLLESLFSIVFNNRLEVAVDDKNIDYLETVICLLLLRKQQVVIKDINPYALLIWTLLSEIINPESSICDNKKFGIAHRVWLACRVLLSEDYEIISQNESEESVVKVLRFEVQDKLRSAIKEQLMVSVQKSPLSVEQRVDIGNVLGKLGDDRKGVGVDKDGLPDIDWVEVAGGEFTFGLSEEKGKKLINELKKWESAKPGYCNSVLGLDGVNCLSIESFSREIPARKVSLKPFRISKHLITNMQFNSFVNAIDGMYSYISWKYWYGWSTASENYHNTIMSDNKKREEMIAFRERECTERPNHPAISISWFDAIAFCKWLSMKTGKKMRLATEAEWECAAGKNETLFVWGDEIDKDRCNNGLHGFNQVCPVGTFAHDIDAVSACEEMNGNVWEWTQSFYGNTHSESDEVQDSIIDIDDNEEIFHSALIAVKGGSFLNKMQSMRNTYRGRDAAGDNFTRHGCRIVEISEEQDFVKVKRPKSAAYSHILDASGNRVWYLIGYANNKINKGDKIKLYSEACFCCDSNEQGLNSSEIDISTANLNIENNLKINDDSVFDAIITVGDGTVVHKDISDMVINFPNATTFWPKQKVEDMFCDDWWCSSGSIRKRQMVQFRIYIKEII